MSYAYTSNLLRGFQTTAVVGDLHYRIALQINARIAEHRDLMNDRTRNRGEKSPMLAKLQHKLETEAQRDLQALRKNLETRNLDLEKQEQAIIQSMPMEKAIPLALALKGIDAGKMVAVCKGNKELALACAIAPSELTGFDTVQAFTTLVESHYPNLKAANEALEWDSKSYNSLSTNLDNTVQALGNSVDWNALESKFDESRLEITPVPKTMAEQNAELAKLEKASGIKPTVGE